MLDVRLHVITMDDVVLGARDRWQLLSWESGIILPVFCNLKGGKTGVCCCGGLEFWLVYRY